MDPLTLSVFIGIGLLIGFYIGWAFCDLVNRHPVAKYRG